MKRSTIPKHDTSNDAAALRRELALLIAERERERAQQQQRIDDLTRRLDQEVAERRKLTALLTRERENPRDILPTGSPGAVPETRLSASRNRFFKENGYLILKGFFEPSQIARLEARIDELWANRGGDCPLVIDCLSNGQRMYFREVDEPLRKLPYKLNDVHLVDKVVWDFAADARLVMILTGLLSSTPVVCNTLLFERSSQQNAHFDTFYMPSKTRNMMCASWIAIDKVAETNGPLFYYPRSHLIEPFRFSTGNLNAVAAEMPAAEAHIRRIIEEYRLEEQRFYPQPGDVLIWHAQLLHGGGPIIDMEETRKSLVTHYWTTLDCPDPADWIVAGEGRYLLRKSHQNAIGKSEQIDNFVCGLATPPEHLASVPADFDPRGYLSRNMDVFHAAMDPYTHYHLYGRKEGRVW
jgi:ectoine hydroxylase-related dioxygenase (phytanoyl-CoA dioxygenase family)